MKSPDARGVSTLHINALRSWRQTLAAIADGQLPTLEELRCGSGFAAGDIKADIRAWCKDLMLEDAMDDVSDRLAHVTVACSVAALKDLRNSLEHEGDSYVGRLDFYLAAMGDDEARYRVVADILGTNNRGEFRRVVFGVAVARAWATMLNPQREIGLGSAESLIRSTAADIEMSYGAAKILDAGGEAQTPDDLLQNAIGEALVDVHEDRSEILRRPAKTHIPNAHSIIVVPGSVLGGGGMAKKELLKGYVTLINRPLPVVRSGNIQQVVVAFRRLMPHAVAQFLSILGHVQEGDPLRLAPVLLVGSQGTGKSTMARAMAAVMGAPFEMHSMAGASDSSLMGTSAQWSSARENVVLQLIRRTEIANPMVCWDELEKTGTGRTNGSALEALLPLLEQHTARTFRDLALEVEVDLSMVSHIATANSLDGIPRPLLDRFKIVRVPEPGWEHVGDLSRSILNRIAKERGLRLDWFPSLQADELEVVRQTWTGGSIRRLERIVRMIEAGRDRTMGQA